MYSWGVLAEQLRADLHLSHSSVSLAGSIMVASSAFVAPLAGRGVRRAGPGRVAVAGAFTAAGGLLAASFTSGLAGLLELLAGLLSHKVVLHLDPLQRVVDGVDIVRLRHHLAATT